MGLVQHLMRLYFDFGLSCLSVVDGQRDKCVGLRGDVRHKTWEMTTQNRGRRILKECREPKETMKAASRSRPISGDVVVRRYPQRIRGGHGPGTPRFWSWSGVQVDYKYQK